MYNSIEGQINGNEGIYEDCRCKKIGDSMCEYQMLFSIVLAFVSVPSGVLSSAVAVAFVPLESLLSSSAAAAAFLLLGVGHISQVTGLLFRQISLLMLQGAGGKRTQTQEYLKGFRAGIATIAMKPGKRYSSEHEDRQISIP